ncbi:MAG: peptide chain release factor N(5)-glutamine methyltransferase [Firmicutes bacterium]|nr:peptide chain release factor N(5)-glutamine methyltransferase [Bacillota bacterium]MCL5038446.1 peptide chain release factor N(5)-glutamine methyltransferase [Bacillota bacterium]
MENQLTLGQVLRWGIEVLRRSGLPEPQGDVVYLLSFLLGTDGGGLYLRLPDPAAPEILKAFQRVIRLRRQRWPASYITGWREFMGIRFKVDQRALIPRPETELLVEAVLELITSKASPLTPAAREEISQANVLVQDRVARTDPLAPDSGTGRGERWWAVADVGTGSGAIAVALAHYCRHCFVLATDISQEALDLAGENARRTGVGERILFLAGDLLEPLFDAGWANKIDLLVSNPPYIDETEMALLPPEIARYEPALALDGGAHGLEFYRRLARGSRSLLKPGGGLALEIGSGQAEAVTSLLRTAGFEDLQVRKDYAGHDRVVLARMPLRKSLRGEGLASSSDPS